LEKRYRKRTRIDTSNINLQTEDLQYNYMVYILSPRKRNIYRIWTTM